jgi:hypothetical protein
MKTIDDAELCDGGSTSFTLVFLLLMSVRIPMRRINPSSRSFGLRMFGNRCCRSGDGQTHALNIFPAGYEFEGGKMAIS